MKEVRKSNMQVIEDRLHKLAEERGLRLEQAEWGDTRYFFWEEGAKFHTAQLSVEFEYSRYYRGDKEDPKVSTFVVSGKSLEAKENRATAANAPWECRYMKSKDLDKVMAVLDKIVRKDNPAERVERAAFEAKARWNCNHEWNRRLPSHSNVEMAVSCAAIDGELPFFLSHGDDVKREIANLLKERDRYVGEWMALEIIDISRKAELASLGVES
jgi:hypothetical protein